MKLTRLLPKFALVLALAFAALGCPDSGDEPDARIDNMFDASGPLPDAAPPDAAPGDADLPDA
jgi:hypothetical protein